VTDVVAEVDAELEEILSSAAEEEEVEEKDGVEDCSLLIGGSAKMAAGVPTGALSSPEELQRTSKLQLSTPSYAYSLVSYCL